MTLVDNFLPSSFQDRIEQAMIGKDSMFPWCYNIHTNDPYQFPHAVCADELTLDTKQFVHRFVDYGKPKSDFGNLVYPIIIMMEKQFDRSFADRVLRIKANLITKQPNYPNGFYNLAHIDGDGDIESAVYYVNDSDGDTVLFNEKSGATKLTINKRISPQKGSLLLFDSSYMHSSTPPTIANERVVINFVFRKDN